MRKLKFILATWFLFAAAACGSSDAGNDPSPSKAEAPVSLSGPAAVSFEVLTDEEVPVSAPFEMQGDVPKAVTFKITTRPRHGDVTVTQDTFLYTPAADFSGNDSFAYEAGWEGGSSTGKVGVVVAPVNDPPALTDVVIVPGTIRHGTAVHAAASGWSDAEGAAENIEYTWVVNGVPIVASGALLPDFYVRKGNWLQVVAYPYDGETRGRPVVSDIAIVENTAPSLTSVTYDQDAYVDGMPITALPLGANDVDGDPIDFLYEWTVNGSTLGSAGNPLSGDFVAHGSVILASLTPYDGEDYGAEVTGAPLSISARPVAVPLFLDVNEDDTLQGQFAATNVDGPVTFTYEVVRSPLHGALSAAGASFTYAGDKDFFGYDFFTYRAWDGVSWSDPVQASIHVISVNDMPVISGIAGSDTVLPGMSATLIASAYDVDDDALTYTWTENSLAIGTGSTLTVGDICPARHLVLQVSDGILTNQTPVSVSSLGRCIRGFALTALADDFWEFNLDTTTASGSAITHATLTLGGTAMFSVTNSTVFQWRDPGMEGIYQVEASVVDSAGYASYYTAAAAITSSVQWNGPGGDRHSTGVQFLAKNLGTAPLEAPHVPTGTTSWSTYVGPDPRYAAYSVDGSAVFVSAWERSGTNPYHLYGVHLSDHARYFQSSAGSHAGKMPVVDAFGDVYLGSSWNPNLYKFSPVDGALQWSNGGYGHLHNLALFDDGRVIGGSNDKNVVSVAASGALSFNTPAVCTDGPYIALSIAADGTSYYGCGDGKLATLSSSGAIGWTYTAGAGIWVAPIVASDGTIYFAANDTKLYALTATGSAKWSVAFGSNSSTQLMLGADGTIYYSVACSLKAVNPADGATQWTSTVGCNNRSPVLGADGTIYLPVDKSVKAISPATGAVKWTWTIASTVWNLMMAPDGTLYAVADDGYLYAIR